VELCPVDAHSIVALCAPRPVFFNGGTTSQWSDPYGIYLTAAAASPAYELLGRTGLVMKDDKPQVDKAYIEGDLGYRYHNGGHTDAPDWPAFFEFAKKYIDF
ncbi:MAG: acetylxylan esterase, partial [Bacteroidales bacterium]|nr:acetylxylan esterase [Bacteroidales bacterium]